jgi:hypothetical protein
MQMQKHQNNCNGVALWCHFSKRTTRSRSIIELLMLWVKKTLQHSVTEEIGKKNTLITTKVAFMWRYR